MLSDQKIKCLFRRGRFYWGEASAIFISSIVLGVWLGPKIVIAKYGTSASHEVVQYFILTIYIYWYYLIAIIAFIMLIRKFFIHTNSYSAKAIFTFVGILFTTIIFFGVNIVSYYGN